MFRIAFGYPVGLLLVLGLLAATPGCLESNTPADPEASLGGTDSEIHVPLPRTGEIYRYEADNGDALNVTVGEFVERRDPWLNTRPGLRLEMTHWDEDVDRGGEGWGFEETVDARGLAIQHWADCGARHRISGEEHWKCVDDRGLAIPSAHGLPGAQGAAVFWGANLTPGEYNVSLDTVLPGNEAWAYRVGSSNKATFGSRECLSATPTGVEEGWIRSLPLYGGAGEITLCEGLVLPAAFESIEGAGFRLVAHEEGGVPVGANRTAEAFSREPVVETTEHGFPLYAAHPEQETPFTTEEAHEVARERVDSYDALFRGSHDGILVHSWYDHEGSRSTEGPVNLVGDTSEHRRRLGALDERGQWVSVAIQKTIQEPGDGPGEREESYEVLETDRSTVHGDVPTRSSLQGDQADLNDTLALGERLTGQPLNEAMGFGLWPGFKAESTVHQGDVFRENGSTLIAWYEDHDPESSGGIRVTFPLRFTVDGPTGTVLSVEGPRDRLNETMR